jgi:hypothetical protein
VRIFFGKKLNACVLIAAFLAGSNSQASEGPQKVDAMQPLDLRQVQVGGEIGRRIDVTINNNLLQIDIDKDFLAPFRTKNLGEQGFVGLGTLIDAAVHFSAYTNDEKVISLKEYLVDEVIKNQLPDGYIGGYPPDIRLWRLWDLHELVYIIKGLTSDYQYFGNKSSLEAACKAADYILKEWAAHPEARIGGEVGIGRDNPGGWDCGVNHATTGFECTMLTLTEQSGDRRYADFCVNHRKLPEWDCPVVVGRRGLLEGHVYGYTSRCLAQLYLNQIQPAPKLLQQSHRLVHFLRANDGLEITGACGRDECFDNDQGGIGAIGETCSSAYDIRLLDSLLQLEGDSLYGDLMERIIYNTLFAAQSPNGRQLRYYTPLEGVRPYWGGDTYCCPNNFRRIISELPSLVYYKSDGGIAVNLYAQSKAELELDEDVSLTVRQETDYPSSGVATFYIDPSKQAVFPLRLRIPRWAQNMKIAVNGNPVDGEIQSGTFFTINRKWNAGDKVEVQMPMPWRFIKGRQKQEGRVALMRGPVVFCLNPDRNPEIAEIDPRLISIYQGALEGPDKDETVRPNGVECRVRAYRPSKEAWTSGDVFPSLSLVLTEFADPGGQLTYFRTLDEHAGDDDELIDVSSDE